MSERRHRREHDETWLQNHWRPVVAWQYVVVCGFDFFVAPIFMALLSAYTKTPAVTWVPLTLQGGGLYHLSMGAIIGVSSYGRTQERVAGINNPLVPPTILSDPAPAKPVTPPVSAHGKTVASTPDDEAQ
jgi:hypothetical protein